MTVQGYRYIPIVGARKVAQLQDSLGAAKITLSPQHLQQLNKASAIELGFPHDFLASDGVLDMVRSESRTRLTPRPQRG